jgi:hypothetical protein
MKINTTYRSHPLLPLMQLLDSIEDPTEFTTRRHEILDAIHLAKPILKDRTPECCRLAKGSFYASHGTATVAFRMARFVESCIKETLHLSNPAQKPTRSKTMTRQPRTTHRNQPVSLSFRQLRQLIPAITTIRSLGGKKEIDINNPAGAYLTVTNSKGNRYFITEANWNDANTIRRAHPENPWASNLYNYYHLPDDHGLYHAAALLRAIEEGDLLDLGNLAA